MSEAVRYAALAARERSIVDAFVSGDTWSPDYFEKWLETHPSETATIAPPDADIKTVAMMAAREPIKAGFIRNALLSKYFNDKGSPLVVDDSGAHLHEALIEGTLDLAAVEFRKPLDFYGCTFTDTIDLQDAKLGQVVFSHCTMNHKVFIANRVDVESEFLCDHMTGCRKVVLDSARIRGSLRLSGTSLLEGEACENNYVLVCADAKIDGNVHLDEGFKSVGEVRFVGATIGANMFCGGATMHCVKGRNNNALYCHNASFGGSVYLNKDFHSDGIVNLAVANIGSNLRCEKSVLFGANDKKEDRHGRPYFRALTCWNASIGANAYINNTEAFGEVNFNMARIGGCLVGNSAKIINENGRSLYCNSVKIGVSAFLRNITSVGEANFVYAEIGGRLVCTGASFDIAEYPDSKQALNCDSISVTGSVFLNTDDKEGGNTTVDPETGAEDCVRKQFTVKGQVFLSGAEIGRDLVCSGGRFENSHGASLVCSMARIVGSVYLDRDFDAKGEVFFRNVTVKGSIYCRGGAFDVFLTPSSTQKEIDTRDAIDLEGAHICKGLYLTQVKKFRGSLDLQDAYAKELADDGSIWMGCPKKKEGVCDPNGVVLRLDRFTYDAFIHDDRLSEADGAPQQGDVNGGTVLEGPGKGSDTSYNFETRFAWLNMQQDEWLKEDFRPQPFTHCAKIMRRMGYISDARRILERREHLQLGRANVERWVRYVKRCMVGLFSGYGYRMRNAFYATAYVWFVGMIVFTFAYANGRMRVVSEDALVARGYDINAETVLPPQDYEYFKPAMYSLDLLLPIIDFAQVSYWVPRDAREPSATPPKERLPFMEYTLPARFASWAWVAVPDLRAWNWQDVPLWLERQNIPLLDINSLELTMLLGRWAIKFFYWFEIAMGWFLTTIIVAGFTGLLGTPRED